jgi:methionyl-tRNA formyltransferase
LRIAFFGTPHFALATLEALRRSRHEVVVVVAQPDRPSGRGMKLQPPPVAQLARGAGLPLLQPEKIRAEFLEELKGFAPELGVVVAYGKILPQALIDLPQHGCINVHGSLLPKWRGAAPVQRSIEAGEQETGVTIMRIDRQLDHGPMFAKGVIAVDDDERTPAWFERLSIVGGDLLVEVVDQIERGEAREVEQDHEAATYAKKIEKEEGRIRWSEPSKALYDRFRAFDPWPGMFFSTAEGEVIKVLDMRRADRETAAEPGTILQANDGEVTVAAGDGALRLITLQRPGKGRLPASDVLRALDLKVGASLS